MTDTSNTVTMLSFGKYRGKTMAEVADLDPQYLQWVIGSNFPNNVRDAARAALDNATSPEEVVVTPCDAPRDGYTVRGGGSFCDGTLWIARMDAEGRHEYMPVDRSGLSGSERSGYAEIEMPTEDGVYAVKESEGTIRHNKATVRHLLLKDGQWYAFRRPADAYAVASDATVKVLTEQEEQNEGDTVPGG